MVLSRTRVSSLFIYATCEIWLFSLKFKMAVVLIFMFLARMEEMGKGKRGMPVKPLSFRKPSWKLHPDISIFSAPAKTGPCGLMETICLDGSHREKYCE